MILVLTVRRLTLVLVLVLVVVLVLVLVVMPCIVPLVERAELERIGVGRHEMHVPTGGPVRVEP